MVPCQARQLVILSLPFAALVAFYLFKRKKNSSHSDPGGTLVPTKPVDKTAQSNASVSKIAIDKKLSLKVIQDHTVKNTDNFVSSTPNSDKLFDDTVTSELNDNSFPVVEQGDIVCKRVVTCESQDQSAVIHDIENSKSTQKLFHSTLIGDEIFTEETVESCILKELESVNNTYLVPEHSVKKSVSKEESKDILLEEQSTLENIALKNKFGIVLPEKSGFIEKSFESELSPDCTEVIKSDLVVKDVSLLKSELPKPLENISADTGLGSQDQSAVDDSISKMAQGQKTEEKTQSNNTGLEQKLASLGIDNQQPTQRVERDSANHSPAEVMLNSPAISTFSDAHSEGSSDSGKGCSDVVTPPSCTPAGGSSVAGDQVPSVFEFVLPQVIVGRLIGRHGTFLHDIRTKTHTNVFIKRHPETNSLKICAIEGTQQDIDAALKMIRQKFPLRRFPELTLERVTFVKNSCLPINPENLQLHLVEGVNNDVILSSLITAGHFFLQLPMHMSYQSLYRLACIMNTVYNTEESPPLPNPQPDVVCVAPAHGGWYRCQILSVDEENNTSDIKFLDYGGFLTVDNSSLRQIRGDFLLLPFQAVECALANVMPAGGEEEWSEEAKQFVQLITTQQTLQAQVYDYTDTGMPLVYLYCTQFYQSFTDPTGYETKVVLLNQELVSRGFAELIDISQEDEQTNVTESS